jgi:hypothetical protein
VGRCAKDGRFEVGMMRRWDEGPAALGGWRLEAIRKEGKKVRSLED